jgi:hypothetical protein
VGGGKAAAGGGIDRGEVEHAARRFGCAACCATPLGGSMGGSAGLFMSGVLPVMNMLVNPVCVRLGQGAHPLLLLSERQQV